MSPTVLQLLLLTTVGLPLLTIPLLLFLLLPRLHRLLTSPPPPLSASKNTQRGHLLIILGSGGHTTEMFSILRGLGSEYLDSRFDRRTWVVSSGDGFSAARVEDFESELELELERGNGGRKGRNDSERVVVNGAVGKKCVNGKRMDKVKTTYTIATVRRARKVHQSLLTTPISSLGCLWDCIRVLRGSHTHSGISQTTTASSSSSYNYGYPDLILTNGPGTGVIMALASLLLLFCGIPPNSPPSSVSSSPQPHDAQSGTGQRPGAMRTIYIESWARVKSLSLSARVLRYFAARVLVQWEGVGGGGGGGGGPGRKSRDLTVGTVEGEVKKAGEKEKEKQSRVWPRELEYVGAVVA